MCIIATDSVVESEEKVTHSPRKELVYSPRIITHLCSHLDLVVTSEAIYPYTEPGRWYPTHVSHTLRYYIMILGLGK